MNNIEIKVQQSFEMKAVSADNDDDSEKNLVTGTGSTWVTECYAAPSKSQGSSAA
jgi:hypothetical protein